jgi:signal transduction histidine kinase
MVDGGLQEMERARPVLQDLFDLNSKIARLGKRFNNLQDTVNEGRSLVRLVTEDIDKLEGFLLGARGIFGEVASMQDAGDYPAYAAMAEAAVQAQLDVIQTNRRLASTLADLLFVVEVAENEEQLRYYVDELDGLARQLEEEFSEASRLAAEADAFFEEKGL